MTKIHVCMYEMYVCMNVCNVQIKCTGNKKVTNNQKNKFFSIFQIISKGLSAKTSTALGLLMRKTAHREKEGY